MDYILFERNYKGTHFVHFGQMKPALRLPKSNL